MMRRLLMKAWKRESGAAMAIVASMLVVLMGVAALSADVAWFYLNASRIQRSADAAALGGVVWLPAAIGTANSTAFDIAFRNGYDDADTDIDVTSGVVAGEPNQLEVEIRAVVPTFFGKVIGFDTMTISRTAIAEFIPPLKLGSPDNQFGNSCPPPGAGCGTSFFWANIHGWWTIRSMGDAYASHCTSAPDNPNCPQNPFARPGGYLYGIESASPFTVQFNDLEFHNTSGPNPTGDLIRTGDRGCEDWGPSAAPTCGPTMVVTLYAPDPTPLDVSDNTVLCTATIPPVAQVPVGAPYSFTPPDGQACWTQSGPGIFPLQVRHVDPGNTADRAGLNRYSVKSTTGNLFALGDFSIYNNTTGTTNFYIAEVPSYYHGKTFVIELFDAGESASNGFLEPIDPTTGLVFNGGECRIYDRNNQGQPWVLRQTIAAGSNCSETVTPGEYNDRWLKFEIDLSPTYSCATCWWKMNYRYPMGGVNDTTTWRAYMIGNPIHIID